MRALLVLGIVLAVGIAGCGEGSGDSSEDPPTRACTEIGCAPGVVVDLGGLAGVDRVRVEVCIRPDGPCRSAPAAGQEQAFIALELPEGDAVDLRVRAKVGRREVVGEVTGEVPIETTRPNGEGCPPVCRQARAEL